jgi:anti-sigma regulatory factor (Ser/Thr protein kinase)
MEAVLNADPVALLVSDPSHASAARLAVQRVAHALDFGETAVGKASIVASEAVSNMVKHAGGGTFLVRPLSRGRAVGIEMMAIDSGPGMDDFVGSSRDGVSTTGTPGTGLGAIERQCDEVQVHTQPGLGTILRMVLWSEEPRADTSAYEVGSVLVPKPGETACGDAWRLVEDDEGACLMVADGLGHGPDASRAAHTAMEVLERHSSQSAERILDLAHGKLRPTRGAAVAVARHPRGSENLSYAGVGNIGATVLDGATRRAMVSHNGIVGHNVHKSQAFTYAWPVGALLIAHSDGLESHWDLAAVPGATSLHPSLVAAILYRKHWRRRDDVVVVAVRRRA